MSSNHYTEERISRLIEVANLYIEDPGIRNELVSRFHQEIGRLVIGELPKSAFTMNRQELAALKAALLSWREEKRNAASLGPG